ncbi:uncharacterized protein [Pagrus major]|uniref:uncharacterized protein n=1 Tax=Pagrus major TaxID=143350 RepID=UPI003CC86965
MKNSWSLLCFLILAMSSFSRGEGGTADPQGDKSVNDTTNTGSPPTQPLATAETDEALGHASASLSPQTNTSTMATDGPSPANKTAEEYYNHDNNEQTDITTVQPTASTPGSGTEGGAGAVTTTVTIATTGTSPTTAGIVQGGQSSWGYVILVLIIVMIIVLCVILYLLRRAARTYSFDLQRPLPVSHHNEPTGTFEPVYLDDLERPAPKDQVNTDDLSPPPVANGTTSTSEEKGPNGESAPQGQSDANGLTGETSPTSNTSPSLGDDPADKTTSPLSSTDLFFDTVGEEIGNNNNPSVCSSDPFVEINLDDPAWCDQLLSSPEAPSSVLPFTPFSFSTSSS